MGRVYLAFTPGGRPVALKMIRTEFGDDEEFRARFGQEVAAAQRVHGLFTAQVLDADPDAPQPWLATSYVPGLSLREAVSQHGRLPRGTVLLLIAGTAEALQAIHAVGIVHRDLKPANVILAADGPRVIDFGIARAIAAPALTLHGSVVGSPRIMAPEQARGETTTPAVDVFALGSLATYAITGHPPFGTDKPLAVLGRVLYEPPDLTGCPPDLRPLIEGCLAKDPSQRPLPSKVITACQVAAGGELAFDRSWLPRALAAATGTVPVPGGPGASETPGAEWTFDSQGGPVAAPAGPGGGQPAELAGPGAASGPADLGGVDAGTLVGWQGHGCRGQCHRSAGRGRGVRQPAVHPDRTRQPAARPVPLRWNLDGHRPPVRGDGEQMADRADDSGLGPARQVQRAVPALLGQLPGEIRHGEHHGRAGQDDRRAEQRVRADRLGLPG